MPWLSQYQVYLHLVLQSYLRADLHQRYEIDAVPTTVIADENGVVKRGFIGPVTATDLWAGLAEVREPGSAGTSDGCLPAD